MCPGLLPSPTAVAVVSSRGLLGARSLTQRLPAQPSNWGTCLTGAARRCTTRLGASKTLPIGRICNFSYVYELSSGSCASSLSQRIYDLCGLRAVLVTSCPMAFAQFGRQAEQHVQALEARGRLFSQASEAGIPVSQLEDPRTLKAFRRLTELPSKLRLVGEEPLTLTEARALYDSCLLDTLCSILRRLQWTHFCTQLDDLALEGRGFSSAGSAMACIRHLLHSRHRVQPSSDAETAELEYVGRYNCTARERGKRFMV